MSNLRIKQISNAGAPGGAVLAFDGRVNIWQKINHTQRFSYSDMSGGFMEIIHDLGRKYVNVTIYDDNDEMLLADSVKVIDDEHLRIGLTSYGQSVNNWVVVVS